MDCIILDPGIWLWYYSMSDDKLEFTTKLPLSLPDITTRGWEGLSWGRAERDYLLWLRRRWLPWRGSGMIRNQLNLLAVVSLTLLLLRTGVHFALIYNTIIFSQLVEIRGFYITVEGYLLTQYTLPTTLWFVSTVQWNLPWRIGKISLLTKTRYWFKLTRPTDWRPVIL